MNTIQHFSDPQPLEWLLAEGRTERLHQCFDTAADSLYLTGLLQAAIVGWLKQEVSASVNGLAFNVPDQLSAGELDKFSFDDASEQSVDSLQTSQSVNQQAITAACRQWSFHHWSHLVESLFLQKKEELDQAGCRLLRVKQRDLAHELYYRLQDLEASFEDLSSRYGVGPEAKKGGMLSMRRMQEMPMGLPVVLRRLAVGELSLPCKVGKFTGLVMLEKYEPAHLDAEVSALLLKMEFKRWIEAVSSQALLQFNFSSSSLSCS